MRAWVIKSGDKFVTLGDTYDSINQAMLFKTKKEARESLDCISGPEYVVKVKITEETE